MGCRQVSSDQHTKHYNYNCISLTWRRCRHCLKRYIHYMQLKSTLTRANVSMGVMVTSIISTHTPGDWQSSEVKTNCQISQLRWVSGSQNYYTLNAFAPVALIPVVSTETEQVDLNVPCSRSVGSFRWHQCMVVVKCVSSGKWKQSSYRIVLLPVCPTAYYCQSEWHYRSVALSSVRKAERHSEALFW